MNLRDCVPKHKGDLAAVDLAVRAGYPALGDIFAELLEWVKDPTWPVAEKLVPLLAQAGPDIAPHLMVVFASTDEEWKVAILVTLAPYLRPEVRRLLRPAVERMATHPTDAERAATVDEAARILLQTWGD